MRRSTVPVPEFGQAGATKESTSYQLSGEVEAVALRLIREHARFAHLDPRREPSHRVGFALQVGKKPEGKGGLHVLAKAVKAPELWRFLGEYDAVVWANQQAWVLLSEEQRSALIAHELCHLGENEKGGIEMLEHDVEEFAWVARQYGQWHPGLEQFAEQLALRLPKP
jgi:hypothetical protein